MFFVSYPSRLGIDHNFDEDPGLETGLSRKASLALTESRLNAVPVLGRTLSFSVLSCRISSGTLGVKYSGSILRSFFDSEREDHAVRPECSGQGRLEPWLGQEYPAIPWHLYGETFAEERGLGSVCS